MNKAAMKYISNSHKAIEADSMKEAAQLFALRKARAEFGKRGDVRTCEMGSYAQDGSLAEFSAFIGTTKGHETTGHNVNFTVYADK